MAKIKIHPLFIGTIPSIIFGFSFMFTSSLLDSFNSGFHLLAHRFNFAVISMSLLVLTGVLKVRLRGKKITPILLLSIFQPFLYFIFETFGIKYASSSQAGIMVAFIPIAVVILATLFLKERPTATQLGFIVLSVAGVITVNSYGLSDSGSMTGIFFLLGAVISGASYTILSRKYSTDFTPVEITWIMMWAGAVVFNIIAVLEYRITETAISYFSPLTDPESLQGLLYLGVLSSVIAFFALNYVLSKIEASRATILTNLTTVVSIVAGVVILHETFTPIQIAGSIMIITGVWGTAKSQKATTA